MTREEALSKAIMTLIYFQAHFCKSKEAIDNTQAIIDTLEQIEQEPKIGHWEMCEDADGIYGVCDICGTDADFTHYGEAYPYCPNCGAKMLLTSSDCNSCKYQNEVDGSNCYECVKGIRNNYTANSEKE